MGSVLMYDKPDYGAIRVVRIEVSPVLWEGGRGVFVLWLHDIGKRKLRGRFRSSCSAWVDNPVLDPAF